MIRSNNKPNDAAYETRRQAREQAVRENYFKTKAELKKLTDVDMPAVEQEIERVNQRLQEPPAIPDEGRLKMNILKAFVYAGVFVVMSTASILLAFAALEFVLYSLPSIFRWFVAAAMVALTMVALHWAIKELSAGARKVLVFVLLAVALANLGLWAMIRAENSSIKARQENGELTAEEAEKKTAESERRLAIVQALLALALETLGGICGSRAATLFDANWPDLSKYRLLRHWERKNAELLRRKVELEMELEREGFRKLDPDAQPNGKE